MFLTDFKILKRWTVKRKLNNNTLKYEKVFVLETDLELFYKQLAKCLKLNPLTPNLKEEVSNFLREFVEEFDKDTEQILAAIVELPFEKIEFILSDNVNLK